MVGEENNIRTTFYGYGAALPDEVYRNEVAASPPWKKQKCEKNSYMPSDRSCDGFQVVPVYFKELKMPQVLFGVLNMDSWANMAVSFLSENLAS